MYSEGRYQDAMYFSALTGVSRVELIYMYIPYVGMYSTGQYLQVSSNTNY